jgi:hypothetical protein
MPPPLIKDASENGSHSHSKSVAPEPFQRPALTSMCGIQPLPVDCNGSSEKIPVRSAGPTLGRPPGTVKQGGRAGARNPFTRMRLPPPTPAWGRRLPEGVSSFASPSGMVHGCYANSFT